MCFSSIVDQSNESNIYFALLVLLADLEIFNLSANELTGQIPVELVNLQGASVHLSGNYEV